jgi:hypothetical protein
METDINGPATAGERPSAVSSDNNSSRQTAHITVPSSRNNDRMETDINGPSTAGKRPSAVSSDNNFSRQTAHTTVPSSRNTRTMSSTNNNTGNTSPYTSRQTSNENTSKASSANCYRPCDIFLDNDNAATIFILSFTLPIMDAKSKECTASLIAPAFASLLTLTVGFGMYVSALLFLISGVSMQTKECLPPSHLTVRFGMRTASLFTSPIASLLALTVGTGMCPLLVLLAGIDMQTKECLSLSLYLFECASLMASRFAALSPIVPRSRLRPSVRSLRLCFALRSALRLALGFNIQSFHVALGFNSWSCYA